MRGEAAIGSSRPAAAAAAEGESSKLKLGAKLPPLQTGSTHKGFAWAVGAQASGFGQLAAHPSMVRLQTACNLP